MFWESITIGHFKKIISFYALNVPKFMETFIYLEIQCITWDEGFLLLAIF